MIRKKAKIEDPLKLTNVQIDLRVEADGLISLIWRGKKNTQILRMYPEQVERLIVGLQQALAVKMH